jgi:long-chain fatty acid transport protein
MRSAIFVLVVTVVTAMSARARAAGIEIDEQSARGVAMAGAQTAVADDPAAVFYNPAGMAFQTGLATLFGGQLVYAVTQVSGIDNFKINYTTAWPTVYLSQRLGSYFAVGIGGFANMGEHFDYPPTFGGRFSGTFIDVTTYTMNPSIAIRPLPFVSFGAGLDITLAALQVRQAIDFGAAEGRTQATAFAAAVGGNAGLMLDIVKHYLRFGFSYRSRIDLDFDGHAAIIGPIELRALTGDKLNASTTLVLPHQFAFGLSTRPFRNLLIATDFRYTLWRDLNQVALTATNPAAPTGTPPQVTVVELALKNSWAIRAGIEGALCNRHLMLRIGAGYDEAPVPLRTLHPLLPDTNRMEASAGLGYHSDLWSIDAGYMFVFLFKKTSELPDYRGTYSTNAHVVSLTATIRLTKWGLPVGNPDFKDE